MEDVIAIPTSQQSSAAQRIECAAFTCEYEKAKQHVRFGTQKISCR